MWTKGSTLTGLDFSALHLLSVNGLMPIAFTFYTLVTYNYELISSSIYDSIHILLYVSYLTMLCYGKGFRVVGEVSSIDRNTHVNMTR